MWNDDSHHEDGREQVEQDAGLDHDRHDGLRGGGRKDVDAVLEDERNPSTWLTAFLRVTTRSSPAQTVGERGRDEEGVGAGIRERQPAREREREGDAHAAEHHGRDEADDRLHLAADRGLVIARNMSQGMRNPLMARAPPASRTAWPRWCLAGEEERQRREERALIATLRIDVPSRLEASRNRSITTTRMKTRSTNEDIAVTGGGGRREHGQDRGAHEELQGAARCAAAPSPTRRRRRRPRRARRRGRRALRGERAVAAAEDEAGEDRAEQEELERRTVEDEREVRPP